MRFGISAVTTQKLKFGRIRGTKTRPDRINPTKRHADGTRKTKAEKKAEKYSAREFKIIAALRAEKTDIRLHGIWHR